MKQEKAVDKKGKNDFVTVTIEDMGKNGEGIGKVDGYTLFVKDAVIGDTVSAKVIKDKNHYAYARLEKVLAPSPYRIHPKCLCHKQCGGCQLQTLSYEKQLEFKQTKIRNDLIRIGKMDRETVDAGTEPIIGMEDPYHYRNKAQYPIGVDKDGTLVAGFYARHSHSIIPHTECCLGARDNSRILQVILDYMEKNKVSAYNEKNGEGLVRHILIRTGFNSGEIMVCLVINKDIRKKEKLSHTLKAVYQREREFLPNQGELLGELAGINGMTSVSVNINTQKNNVIMGQEVYTLWGKPTIQDTIHVRDMGKEGYPYTGEEFTFNISPLSFYQVNPTQAEKLYSLALHYIGFTGEEVVWDLYCGIGTISLLMAKKAKKVYGVEEVAQAIQDARENAERNSVGNVEYIVGKAEEVLPTKCRDEKIAADVIVVDPPRKGCDEACLAAMIQMKAEKIVYISCDSATLARDLKILCDGGYKVEKIRGVDMFGWTVHVETVVLLEKKAR